MASFRYTVDTAPMANEMNSVSRHVNGTTGAVVAMQAAVILAEERGADHICDNVNKGFYSLIRSQISQKLAKFKSDVDSNLMQMDQQKKALTSIQTRMERDYHMISSRYTKLFAGLNANLRTRIFELDKPTIDFAFREVDRVSNRTKYLTATIPVTQTESIALSQKIIASNIKKRGLNVINSMQSFIGEMTKQKKLTDQILISDALVSVGIAYIPVIIYETNRDSSEQLSIDIATSNVMLDANTKSAIKNRIFGEMQQLIWHERQGSDEISNQVSRIAEASDKPARIKDLALELYRSNRYSTIN